MPNHDIALPPAASLPELLAMITLAGFASGRSLFRQAPDPLIRTAGPEASLNSGKCSLHIAAAPLWTR